MIFLAIMPITFIIIFSPKSHFRSHVFFSAEHLWPSPWTQLEKFNGHLLKCARKQLHVTNVLIVLLMLSTTVLQSSSSTKFKTWRFLSPSFCHFWCWKTIVRNFLAFMKFPLSLRRQIPSPKEQIYSKIASCVQVTFYVARAWRNPIEHASIL